MNYLQWSIYKGERKLVLQKHTVGRTQDVLKSTETKYDPNIAILRIPIMSFLCSK